MFGLTEIKNTFGALTVAFVIEIVVAIVGICIAYKKLKDKIIGSYKEREQQKKDIEEALTGVRGIPEIQQELKNADDKIIETCKLIQDGVNENQKILNERLDSLEDRERNALKAKIIDLHRMFTSKKKNPMQAWSEMEHHSFFELVKDYEALGGNDYVHKVILPAMNELDIIPVTNLNKLKLQTKKN